MRRFAGGRSGTYPVACARRVTIPPDAVETPATRRNSVDLPDPFTPPTRTTSPPASVSPTPSSTGRARS